ncbi:glycosyltransferase family 4 protein [Mariniblastus fucicola]|uniref:Spore coat protein SA n=1 Tax=Mariniblastus fucicola TaxID=980251 RepID=A0A5B9PCL6_9BACT|nr:glycosyltransferase family 4 protein [Mariniblastus fucicola]QEG20851.1 Spore coat protein SA [Mariniblastus fucicola]
MHALLISEYGALNGGEFSFLAALPKLQDAGFEFTAALPREFDFAALLTKNNVRVKHFSFHMADKTRKPQQLIRVELAHLIRDLAPDIVHANSLAAGRILGPVTAKLNTIGLGYLRDIIKLSRKATDDVSQLDQIVAVSHATADFHVAAGMPAERIEVIHNGVDLQRFRPDWIDGTKRANSDRKVCLCIGQIGRRKGVDLTLRTLAAAFQHAPKSEVWIVGERHSQKQEAVEYEQELHRFAEENFEPGSVKWLGRRTDIPELMRRADVLIHAARQEPLGRVLLESAASGLPIVTTDIGGTPEILQGMHELMFPPAEFERAAPTIVELLSKDDRRVEVSKALRQIAEQNFSAERAGDDLARCYRHAVGLSAS